MENNGYKTFDMGDGLWRIEDGGVHSYLIEGTERSILVDAGVSGGDLLGAAKAVNEKPITLICTHADHDHVASAPQFDEVWLHPAEFERFLSQDIKPIPMRPLWDNETIDLGGRTLTVIHIPGHTPGSIALFDNNARFLIVGDSVSDYAVWMFGSGRCFPAYICSIERLIKMIDCFDTLHSAHGSPALNPDILHETLDVSRLMLAGKIEGTPPPQVDASHKFYKSGRIGFMY
jgi:glyoxylase-like metal-dependent hydrolase (beta-lactamase superfamily II)